MNMNPYASPAAVSPTPVAVERPTRESLAELINQFLDSKITAFEFDERLDLFRESDDPIVNHVAYEMWFHYDDCDDHLVCFTKPQWDYFQRLLLVLSSDCHIEKESTKHWSLKQLVAVGTLGAFVYSAFQIGWGPHLLLLSVPFGIVSIFLSLWRTHEVPTTGPYEQVIFPFATFSDLATAYRLSNFQKAKYPKHIGQRNIRSPLMGVFWQLHMGALWLLLSPLPLLFQSLPVWDTEVRVVATSQ